MTVPQTMPVPSCTYLVYLTSDITKKLGIRECPRGRGLKSPPPPPNNSVNKITEDEDLWGEMEYSSELDRCNSGRALFVERSFSLVDVAHRHTVKH